MSSEEANQSASGFICGDTSTCGPTPATQRKQGDEGQSDEGQEFWRGEEELTEKRVGVGRGDRERRRGRREGEWEGGERT